MKRMTVNGELTFTCPDGFRDMTAEEVEQAFTDHYRSRAGVRDEERHVIFVVQWHKVNVLLAALIDPGASLRNVRFRLKRLLKDYEYRETDTFSREIAGRDVKAFRYEYRVRGILQEGEIYLLRHKAMIYTLYTVTRCPVTEDARRLIGEILNSINL